MTEQYIVASVPLEEGWMDLPCYDDMGRYRYGTLIFESEKAFREFQSKVSGYVSFLLSRGHVGAEVKRMAEEYCKTLYREEYEVKV